MDEVRGAATACVVALGSRLVTVLDALSVRVAGASNAFALASTSQFAALTPGFLEAFDGALSASLSSLELNAAEQESLDRVVHLERVYLQGVLDGGAIQVAIRDAFPDGDWDEEEPVKKVIQERFRFLSTRIGEALVEWASAVDAARKAAVNRPPTPAPRSVPVERPQQGVSRSMPAAEPPTQLEPMRPQRGPTESERRARLSLMLGFTKDLGIRLKKVPSKPSVAWLDKLQAKLEEIAAKKGVPNPFAFTEDSRGSADTMAFVLPADPEAMAKLQVRVDEMVAKAERAGLKLGKIPDQPSDQWLAELDAKLDVALAERRKERKERREKQARQRKERIARLKAGALELAVDIGKIPPFPTDDWLARAELRLATKMLPASEGSQDRGRAERLANLLARASEADMELEVPPDPNDVWLGWAESQVDKALGGGDIMAVGEDPDEVVRSPTLLFEEGTVQEQRWTIDKERFLIGRSRSCDIQMSHDGQLSRQHCAIMATDEGFSVEDLRSTQGTRLNDQPVRSPMAIQPGDVITIGETSLVFRYC